MNYLLLIALAAAILGGASFEKVRATRLQTQIRELQDSQPATRLDELRRQIADIGDHLAAAEQEQERLRREPSNLPALRAEAVQLRKDADELARLKAAAARLGLALDDWRLPLWIQLRQALEQTPERGIPELQLLNDLDWLGVVQSDQVRFNNEDQLREALCTLRTTAKERFADQLRKALVAYTQTRDGQLPADLAELKPFLPSPVDDAILQRYRMVRTGNVEDLGRDDLWAAEKALAVDEDHDHLFEIGSTTIHFRNFSAEERERQALLKLAR